jgi:8-hydroxy-5-deazaflavin:NADPH oxidoreductase
MKLAVLGAGNVGATIGLRWAGSGHTVIFGVPDPGSQKYLELKAGGAVALTTTAKAAADADVIVIAVPWAVATDLVRSLGDLGSSIIIDCTNAIQFGASGVSLLKIDGPSTTEVLAQAANNGRFVKTLNQVGSYIMADPSRSTPSALMYVAGDDQDARKIAMELTAALGFDARDAGPLRNAAALDHLALLFMHQAMTGPDGRNFVHAVAPWPTRR